MDAQGFFPMATKKLEPGTNRIIGAKGYLQILTLEGYRANS